MQWHDAEQGARNPAGLSSGFQTLTPPAIGVLSVPGPAGASLKPTAPPPPAGLPAESITGSAVWHEPADEPYGVLGLGYPAVDPSAGCVDDTAAANVPGESAGYRQLPYLAVGTSLRVRNECSHLWWTLPVTRCAPVARLFNDHCATCRTSPRGRVADLTLASFVALGGELQAGCFNATLTIGR